MKNVAVVGSQWGDEGKGKIVDWLSSEADIVVCLLYTSPSPRDAHESRMPSSA